MPLYLDARPTRRTLIAAAWTATMFCYVYGDYFGLYVPGALAAMARGAIGPLGHATDAVLVGVALMMAVPSVMIFLTLWLPLVACRALSILLGALYTAIIGPTLPGSPPFYVGLGAVEMALTLTIVALAWRWPRQAR